ncbi:MAG: hypothetical protein D6702_08505 [Planctomycetota bacterium]|nr:MAG: hypothetical protein D6702_08505 [Planctomycetota bacterium]
MERRTAVDRLVRGLARMHLALALVPLLFLAAALARAAGAGFTPAPDDYPRVRYRPGPAADVVLATWRQAGIDPADRVVAVWGLADAGREPEPDGPGLGTALRLAEAGARLRLCDPRLAGRTLDLPAGGRTEVEADPWSALDGATDLLLDSDLPLFAGADPDRLAAALPPGGGVFDCLEALDGPALRDRGLAWFPVGGPGWPPWLDPDFRAFADRLRDELPADARLLLWPERPPVPSPRGRWYLLLAYELAPRAVLLPEPELASGTAVQYRQWVRRLGSGFDRSPAAARAVAEKEGATHLLRFVPRADFRAEDWRLEEVRR